MLVSIIRTIVLNYFYLQYNTRHLLLYKKSNDYFHTYSFIYFLLVDKNNICKSQGLISKIKWNIELRRSE